MDCLSDRAWKAVACPPPQAGQPIPLFRLFARDHGAGGPDAYRFPLSLRMRGIDIGYETARYWRNALISLGEVFALIGDRSGTLTHHSQTVVKYFDGDQREGRSWNE